jgi:Arc/MetJ-type ribon-helix-helix transcriptional regulator
MARITGSYPDDLDLLIEGAVETGAFGSKSDALREFVREYFEDYKNERIAAAVAPYERERITAVARRKPTRSRVWMKPTTGNLSTLVATAGYSTPRCPTFM